MSITRLNAALEGRYRIKSELGEGGMAAVYVATTIPPAVARLIRSAACSFFDIICRICCPRTDNGPLPGGRSRSPWLSRLVRRRFGHLRQP